jgi:hypothetical protein
MVVAVVVQRVTHFGESFNDPRVRFFEGFVFEFLGWNFENVKKGWLHCFLLRSGSRYYGTHLVASH